MDTTVRTAHPLGMKNSRIMTPPLNQRTTQPWIRANWTASFVDQISRPWLRSSHEHGTPCHVTERYQRASAMRRTTTSRAKQERRERRQNNGNGNVLRATSERRERQLAQHERQRIRTTTTTRVRMGQETRGWTRIQPTCPHCTSYAHIRTHMYLNRLHPCACA